MKVILAPSWALSNEYPASPYGRPVLVYRSTGRAFGPGDFVQACALDPYAPAAKVVARLAQTLTLDADATELVAHFKRSVLP
jgi:hypothetical protein